MHPGARVSILSRWAAIAAIAIVLLLATARLGQAQGTCSRSCGANVPRDIHGCCKKRPRPRPTAPPPEPEPVEPPAVEERTEPEPEPPAEAAPDWMTSDDDAVAEVEETAEPWEGSSVPWSPTLERGVKLYDAADYYSAAIELQKVVAGDTEDDDAGRERAEFFLAKTLYQMGYHVGAQRRFAAILEAGPAHSYRQASQKWLLAVVRLVPAPETLGFVTSLEDAELQATIADPTFGEIFEEFAYWVGRSIAREREPDAARAESFFSIVSPRSELASLVHLERARLRLAADEIDDAASLFASASKDPRAATSAVWTAARALRRMRQLAALPTVLAGASTSTTSESARAIALLELSRLALERGRGTPGLEATSMATFDAVAVGTYCSSGPSRDVLASSRALRANAGAIIGTALTYDDHLALFEYLAAELGQDDVSDPGRLLVRIALQIDGLGDELVWLEAIDREMELYDKANDAWKTTQVATDLAQTLYLEQAVAEANLGRWFREHLTSLRDELRAFDASDSRFAAGPDVADGAGVQVSKATCTAFVPPDSAPAAPPASQARGCAGCASSNGAVPGSVLLILTALGLGRRRRDHGGQQLTARSGSRHAARRAAARRR
jgi:tetratricopeptide (TPR) repeat protein